MCCNCCGLAPNYRFDGYEWGIAANFSMTGLVLILPALLFPFTAAGQAQQYTVATGQYVLDLPSAQWRPIAVPGREHPRDVRFSDGNGVFGYEE